MKKLKIGISMGDMNGVGLEVILKTLHNRKMLDMCVPVIYGSSKVVSYHKNIVGIDFQFQSTTSCEKLNHSRVNVVNCWDENVNITLGQASDESGKYAFKALETATIDLRSGAIDALVTAPINKEAMKMASFPFPGHTEYLTKELGSQESLMLMVNGGLRIGLVTNHLPIGQVAKSITRDSIMRKLRIMEDTLRIDFGIEKPTIAILGLNPHAGDGGVLGEEEDKYIRPVIIQRKKAGSLVMGPYPADGFFGSSQYRKFDGILAMYHDQGLIPFKALSFGEGVNYTAGLSAIRTSPDHGTAYDIAGRNLADPSSFRSAIYAAIDIARNRSSFHGMRANAIGKKNKPSEVQKESEVKDIPEV
ncbi:MAG: 4-hydroxythreonine-4-phosphate dehydrogenase PdxA [Saprospiraceae bacterium]